MPTLHKHEPEKPTTALQALLLWAMLAGLVWLILQTRP